MAKKISLTEFIFTTVLSILLIGLFFKPNVVYGKQPDRMPGTGTYSTGSGGAYETIGYSLMFGGYITAVSIEDEAVIVSNETSSPLFDEGFKVVTLAGNERRARGSVYIRRTDGTYKWYNYEIRINPPNFNKNNTVIGRSLLDNLYRESGVDKDDLTEKLTKGGTAWINAINSGRVLSSDQDHSRMYPKRLWSQGSSIFSIPSRTYVDDSIINAFYFTSFTRDVLKLYYDNKFTFPAIVEVDDKPPRHIFQSLTGNQYTNGNDYWVRPNTDVKVTFRQYDPESGNKHQYIRFMENGSIAVRSRHDFDKEASYNNRQVTNPHISINSANRTENTAYGRVEWTVRALTHGKNYDIEYYYQDIANNYLGFNDSGMNLRVDGVAPSLNSSSITGERYKNGSTYWVRPNDKLNVTLRQYDGHSGNKYQYLKLTGNGEDIRGRHDFNNSTATNMQEVSPYPTSTSNISLSANRTENSSYGKVTWTIHAKTHGTAYDIWYHFRDNVSNNYGYDTGVSSLAKIAVDGQAPIVQYRNKSDTDNFHNSDWQEKIEVRLKFNDLHSGYKRSRYAWNTSSTIEPSSWSSWQTNSNYVVSIEESGKWYLWVQSEDNVGNIETTVKGDYKINRPPIADFTFSPSTIYNDTNVTFSNKSSDPDGDTLTYQWAYQEPNSSTWVNFSTAKDPQRIFNKKGTWNIRLTVSDGIASHSVTKILTVQNRSPIADFTFSPSTIYNDTNVTFSNKSSDPDGDTLTYQWAYQEPNSSTWVNFSTAKDPQRVFNKIGTWNIRLTVSDGTASHSVTKILTVQNRSPVADFEFEQPIYEGEPFSIINKSYDPDKHGLEASWKVKEPNGKISTLTNWDITINKAIAGTYEITLTVTDPYGRNDSITKNIYVTPLVIIGNVYHTEYWKIIHEYYGHLNNQFYSGETFILKSLVTKYPVEYVKVTLHGTKVNNQSFTLEKTLTERITIEDNYLYNGDMYENFMSKPDEKIKNGTIYFHFQAKWKNGIIKDDIVPVEIIDDVYRVFNLHRTN